MLRTDLRASLDDFSAEGVLLPTPPELMASSKGLPGVLGVLADPKAAKAPEPSPKAVEPPPAPPPPPPAAPPGDVRPPPGVVAEKGLPRPPWEEMEPPLRRERDEKSLEVAGVSVWFVESERLLLVLKKGGENWRLVKLAR